jgi:two-component system NtrC family sensor kinase
MRVALKIIAVMVSLVLMVLAVEAVLRSRSDAALYQQDLLRSQRILGRALREAGELAWREHGLQAAERIVAAAAADEHEIAVRLLHEDSTRAELETLRASPDLRLNSEDDLFQLIRDDALRTVVPLYGPNDHRIALELTTPLKGGREYLAKSMHRFGFVAGLLVLATSVIGSVAGGWIVGRPIGMLVRQTRSLAAGNFVRSELRESDEIGELGRALDRTSDRLAAAREQLEHETHQRIAALDKLRQADRVATIGTLAAGVAHELGTPLHVIAGRAQRIARSNDSAQIASEAAIIVEQCQVVQDIVRGLLDFAGPPARERCELDLGTVVRRTVTMIEPLLRRSKATVRFERSADIGNARVLGNAGQLQQLFTNLLVNAAQAMTEGGEIRVRIEHRQHDASHNPVNGPDRSYVVVRVADQGAGMNAETLEHIFDPFFTTKPLGEGTGLGLSIAYGIVRDHGGWVDVSSAPGHGSEFVVGLPELEVKS